MEKFIETLRKRASYHRLNAFFMLFLVVISIGFGTWLFIYISPKIAAQDIEQQKKISTSDAIISNLANLDLNIEENKNELKKVENELIEIRRKINRGGNSSEIYNKYGTFIYYDYENGIPRGGFGSPGAYGKRISFSDLSLKDTDDLIKNIIDNNAFLNSEEAKNKYLDILKKEQLETTEKLLEARKESAKLQDEYNYLLKKTNEIGNSILLNDMVKSIYSKDQYISELENELLKFEGTFASKEYLNDFENFKNKMLQANDNTVKSLKTLKPELENNLERQKELLMVNERKLELLRSRKATLDAEKHLALSNIKNSEPLINDNKLTFHISTNIARFGIMMISLFLAQVFVSIYRYSIKISNFYDARADALQILTQTHYFENNEISNLIETFSNIYSPDKVDFGKVNQASIKEVIAGIQPFINKSQPHN